MLYGDIYFMQERVKEEYPNHEIVHVGNGRYNVVEKRKMMKSEGIHNGCSLFSCHEVADVVFNFDHTPDMRVLQQLRDSDWTRHERGALGWYDDMMERNAKAKQRKEEKWRDDIRQNAIENHRQIMNEVDGMSKSTFGGV